MPQLLHLSRAIDTINTRIGRAAATLVLAAVLVSAANAIARKLFSVSSNAALEIQPLLFGGVFLLCAPWALINNAHIRIDVAASQLAKRTRQWIDVVGHALFLLPMATTVAVVTWPYAWRSLLADEQSINPGGLPQYPAKLLIAIGFTLLAVQAVSELIKALAALAIIALPTSAE